VTVDPSSSGVEQEADETLKLGGDHSFFKPNSDAQLAFMVSKAPEVLISSAYGKGKSRVICEKAHYLCLGYPGVKVVLARKMRAHLGATTLRTLLEEVVDPAYIGWGWRPAADGGSTLYYPNGSEILIVGLDNPGRARSGAFTAAYVDQCEELDEEEWVAIAGRLRFRVGPYRQLGGACNPDSPTHFLYKRFHPQKGTHPVLSEYATTLADGRVLPAGRVLRDCIVSGPQDNYENLPDDYLERLALMTGRYKERFVDGRWIGFEGMVYDVYRETNTVKAPPPSWVEWGGYPPPTWRRYRGIDFGFVNPFVCLWLARDPATSRMWLYREIYMTHRTVKDHVITIRRVEQEELAAINRATERMNNLNQGGRRDRERLARLPFSMSISDHDAEDRAQLEAAGFRTVPAIKEVTAGIQTVYAWLTQRQWSDGFGSRLAVCKDALVEKDEVRVLAGEPTCTADELAGYRYPRDKANMDEKDPKDVPAKKNDHGCDALRYVLHTLATLGDARVVRLGPTERTEED